MENIGNGLEINPTAGWILMFLIVIAIAIVVEINLFRQGVADKNSDRAYNQKLYYYIIMIIITPLLVFFAPLYIWQPFFIAFIVTTIINGVLLMFAMSYNGQKNGQKTSNQSLPRRS